MISRPTLFTRHGMMWGILAALCMVIWVAYPINNHSEAEDAFAFSVNLTELSVPQLASQHTAHFMFHICAKMLWILSGKPDAFVFLKVISVFGGLASGFFLWLIVRQHFKVSTAVAAMGVAFYFSLYSVWRYSHEAEVYGVAWCAGLASCWLGLRPASRCLGGILGGFFCGFHLMLSLLTGPAMGLAIWHRDGFRPAFRYCLSAVAGMSLMFGLCKFLEGQSSGGPALSSAVPGIEAAIAVARKDAVSPLISNITVPGPKAVLREAVAFGSNLLTGNWLYNDPVTASKLVKLFPEKNQQEEVMVGQALPSSFFYLNAVTFVLSLLGLAAISVAGLRPSAGNSTPVSRLRFPFWNDWRVTLILTWMVFYAVVQFVIGAAAPESWIPLVPSVALLFTLGCASFGARRQWLFGGSVVLLVFVHNFTGGIAPLISSEHDWNQVEARWLVEQGTVRDVAVTNDIEVLSRYIRWHSKVKLVNLGQCATEEEARILLKAAWDYATQSGGRVFLLREVLQPPTYLLKLNRPDLIGLRTRWTETQSVVPLPGASPELYQLLKFP